MEVIVSDALYVPYFGAHLRQLVLSQTPANTVRQWIQASVSRGVPVYKELTGPSTFADHSQRVNAKPNHQHHLNGSSIYTQVYTTAISSQKLSKLWTYSVLTVCHIGFHYLDPYDTRKKVTGTKVPSTYWMTTVVRSYRINNYHI